MLLLEDYQAVEDILGKVLELRFRLETAEDSEDCSPEDFLSVKAADENGLFSIKLKDTGTDWLIATAELLRGKNDGGKARKLIERLEHPACLQIKPRILLEEQVQQETFSEMQEILEKENRKFYWIFR